MINAVRNGDATKIDGMVNAPKKETDQQLVGSFLEAAIKGDVKTIKRMLRNGMPVDVSDGDGWTALHWASMLNQTDVIKHMLDEKANVNRQTRHKDTPLHRAALYNKTEAVRMLIEHGADVNLKNDENETPLDEADKGSEIERLLLQAQQSTL